MLLVIGDVAVDSWLDCEVVGVSREAPVVTTAEKPGPRNTTGAWAANLACNCAAMGVETWLLSAFADDGPGADLCTILRNWDVTYAPLPEVGLRTGHKVRYTVDGHIVSRHDVRPQYNLQVVLPSLSRRLDELPQLPQMIAVSDNGSGLMTPRVVRYIAEFASRHNIRTLVDTRAASYAMYAEADFDIIRINLPDALSVGRAEGWLVADAAPPIVQAIELSSHIVHDVRGVDLSRAVAGRRQWAAVTAGAAGSVVNRGDGHDVIVNRPVTPARVSGVRELSGAGDTYTAALIQQVLMRPEAQIDWQLPDAAAGYAVMQPGTCVVPLVAAQDYAIAHLPRGYQRKFVGMVDYFAWRTHQDTTHQTVGLASGCFDGLHAGHLDLLEFAERHCDKLVVVLNDDVSLREVKGEDRPRVPFEDRVRHLCALPYVDRVVAFDGDVDTMLYRTRPHVYIKGQDTVQQYDGVPGTKAIERLSARLLLCPTNERYFVLEQRSSDEGGQPSDSDGGSA